MKRRRGERFCVNYIDYSQKRDGIPIQASTIQTWEKVLTESDKGRRGHCRKDCENGELDSIKKI